MAELHFQRLSRELEVSVLHHTLDKFDDGNPRNDDANGTVFEHDIMGNQLWHGGDVKGLMDSLDYLQRMGIKVCMDDFRRCCLSC